MSAEYPHGTYRGYNRGCRCEECRAARYAYWKAWNARVKANPPPGVPQHGTYSRYRIYGCRCDTCREAVVAYQRERREIRRLTAEFLP